MFQIQTIFLQSIIYEYIMKNVVQNNDKGEIEMKHTYTLAYPFGDSTLERLVRLYENFGIASICCGDDKGYYVEADHVVKYNIKKEA